MSSPSQAQESTPETSIKEKLDLLEKVIDERGEIGVNALIHMYHALSIQRAGEMVAQAIDKAVERLVETFGPTLYNQETRVTQRRDDWPERKGW